MISHHDFKQIVILLETIMSAPHRVCVCVLYMYQFSRKMCMISIHSINFTNYLNFFDHTYDNCLAHDKMLLVNGTSHCLYSCFK